MIRCRWCGADNYAIDQWCSTCSGHLDWGPRAATPAEADAVPEVTPPAEEPVAATPVAAMPVAEAPLVEAPVAAASEPTLSEALATLPAPPTARRRPPVAAWVIPAAAAAIVALLLALPVAGWFRVPAAAPALPETAALPSLSSTPSATPSPSVVATPNPADAAPNPTALPQVVAPPAVPPAVVTNAGDPTAAVAGFYQSVASHQFGNAAATWSDRMRANYPPPTFIDHRFASTRQMDLRGARVLTNNGIVAVVSIDLIEVMDGATRHWVGTWQLVATPSGWLLNQPNLRPGV